MDIVWTWVNGSSQELQSWRSRWRGPVELTKSVVRGRQQADRLNHFRAHNELLYSMRSSRSLDQEAVGRRLLFTTDLPSGDGGERQGQVPSWFATGEGVDLEHHWRAWTPELREASLPTFNSLAIETQLGHLDIGDTFLYMNDDAFFGAPSLSLSDLASPLFGPVIRLQSDLFVEGTPETMPGDDVEGEWPSLRRTAWLLDRRFGKRKRVYTEHTSKVFSRSLLREMELTWPQDFARVRLICS